ncbi:MAG: VPLPA-CTERM sorting domain-containing protein [Pseudooceanicola sp.]
MKQFLKAAAFASATLVAGVSSASAVTLSYTGQTTGNSYYTSKITRSPVNVAGSSGSSTKVIAGGLNMTSSSSLGNFVAWCLDLEHFLKPVSNYVVTTNPFSNTGTIGAAGIARIQSVFDANFASVNAADLKQSAAFQLALWEALYDGNSFSLTSGLFKARGYFGGSFTSTATQISSLAAGYLSNAQGYLGAKVWDLTFLESTASGRHQSQALVTVTMAPPPVPEVPLPAGGVLLVTALGGIAAVRRRRKG